MNSLSRIVARSALKRVAQVPVAAPRLMSTMLDKKEMAEEAKYIRSMEARNQAAIRANLERIMALEDHHDEKKELVELLAKKEEDQSVLARLGLNDWKFAVPVGMLVGIPALANEVIILDAEMQLTACFVLFCSTMYTQVGPMIGKALDDYKTEVHNEIKSLDKTVQNQIQNAMNANEMALSLSEDFKQLYSLTDNLAVAQAEVLNRTEEHKYREAVVKKLDSLHALEEAATSAIRNRMISTVKSEVVKTFADDKKAKEDALNQAIAVLSGGASAKLGKDIVGDAFKSSLSNYRSNYSKQPAGSDPILVQLEKDMAAVATAPVVDGKGGNVYVTHQLA